MEYPEVLYEPGPERDAYAKTFQVSSSDQSLVTSILSAGTFFGAIIAGDVADKIGRRLTIILGCAIFCVGGVIQAASSSEIAVMCVGRVRISSYTKLAQNSNFNRLLLDLVLHTPSISC